MNTSKIFMQQQQQAPELSLDDIVNFTLNKQPGNVIEIGCGGGDTSIHLLRSCKKFNRKYIAIDPFEDNWNNIPDSYGKPYPYSVWKDKVKHFQDRIVHFKLPSQDPSLYELLEKQKPFAFAFVDGIQYKQAVLSDINLLVKLNCAVICIDDYDRNTELSQVPDAVNEFIEQNPNFKVVAELSTTRRRKAYIVDSSW